MINSQTKNDEKFSSTGIRQQHMTHGFLTVGRLRKSRCVDATVDGAIARMRRGAGAGHGGEHLAKFFGDGILATKNAGECGFKHQKPSDFPESMNWFKGRSKLKAIVLTAKPRGFM